jgi:hypothetical protein
MSEKTNPEEIHHESDYSTAGEGNTPHTDHMTDDGFVKWYDQKNFGTKRGSFGMSQQTTGRALNYDNFVQKLKDSGIQGN